MSLFFPPFFQNNEYFIDEKVQFLKFHNVYRIYDAMGLQIGTVTQEVPNWQKFLRVFIKKNILPFSLTLTDNNDVTVATLKRGWTFWLSTITIMDGNDVVTGSIRQKFRLVKPRFRIYDNNDICVAEIRGDWKAWNFDISNSSGNLIGSINKKWGGLAREIFTTADKYHVTILPEYAQDRNKLNILATAIAIDMVMKESK